MLFIFDVSFTVYNSDAKFVKMQCWITARIFWWVEGKLSKSLQVHKARCAKRAEQAAAGVGGHSPWRTI